MIWLYRSRFCPTLEILREIILPIDLGLLREHILPYLRSPNLEL